MYTVNKGPAAARFISSRNRRDLSVKVENLDPGRESRRKNSGGSDDSNSSNMSNSPKPTFNTTISNKNKKAQNSRQSPVPSISPAHRSLVNYLASRWESVQKELDSLDSLKRSGMDETEFPSITRYEETETHPLVKNFKPFEIELFWASRLYSKLKADIVQGT